MNYKATHRTNERHDIGEKNMKQKKDRRQTDKTHQQGESRRQRRMNRLEQWTARQTSKQTKYPNSSLVKAPI